MKVEWNFIGRGVKSVDWDCVKQSINYAESAITFVGLKINFYKFREQEVP